MDFKTKIAKLGKYRKLSQKEIAAAIGLSSSSISQWAQGRKNPAPHYLDALARALRVPVDWLVDDAREWPPPGEGGGETGEESRLYTIEVTEDEWHLIWVFRQMGMPFRRAFEVLTGGEARMEPAGEPPKNGDD